MLNSLTKKIASASCLKKNGRVSSPSWGSLAVGKMGRPGKERWKTEKCLARSRCFVANGYDQLESIIDNSKQTSWRALRYIIERALTESAIFCGKGVERYVALLIDPNRRASRA